MYRENSGQRPGRHDSGDTTVVVAVAGELERASTPHIIAAAGTVTETVVDDTAGAVEEEEWEMADDRMEACLQGGVSLTSLDVSSPRITASFVKM